MRHTENGGGARSLLLPAKQLPPPRPLLAAAGRALCRWVRVRRVHQLCELVVDEVHLPWGVRAGEHAEGVYGECARATDGRVAFSRRDVLGGAHGTVQIVEHRVCFAWRVTEVKRGERVRR